MEIEQQVIDKFVRRVLEVASPARIILFGSAATGSMTRDSDIDILVLWDAPLDLRQKRRKIREALRGMGCSFDILVMSAERFNESKDIVGTIAYPASRQGRVVYEAA